jgi:hypothetical protein
LGHKKIAAVFFFLPELHLPGFALPHQFASGTASRAQQDWGWWTLPFLRGSWRALGIIVGTVLLLSRLRIFDFRN